jgi:ribosome-associated toxin RatA of RatAB toxin-antitoxin module
MNRKLFVIGSLVALASLSGVASAALPHEGDPCRYEVQTPRSDIKAGAAFMPVHAPLDVVRQLVTNYEAYGEYIKRFDKAKVIGRHGDTTDVYLQVPLMKGAAKIWAVLRFEAPKTVGEDVVVVGKLIKGNVKRLDAKWRISKMDERTTKLDLELLIVPDWVVPLPNSMVTDEAMYAASRAVLGMGNASQERAR